MEHVCTALANGLRNRGHTVIEAFAEDAFDRKNRASQQWGVRLRTVKTWKKLPTPRSLIQWGLDGYHLRSWLRELRPDVVNVHFITDQALPFLALRSSVGYRLVLTSHGSDLLRTSSAVARKALPILLPRADHVVAVSDAVADRAHQIAPSARVTTIPNGINLDFWSPRADIEPDPHLLVQIGRLHHVKGQDVLLNALPRLRQRVPDARVVFVGDGPDHRQLEALAEDLGLSDAVTFVGACSHDEVRDWVHRAGVGVLPSRSEGLPLTLLEMMATGTPVVATSVGGVPSTVADPPAARLVPPEDPDALADSLADVLTDPATRSALIEQGQARAAAFSWTHTLDAHERVLIPAETVA